MVGGAGIIEFAPLPLIGPAHMPTLVLLRHGESTWNLENRFTGWTDVGLTDTGVLQAREAGGLKAWREANLPLEKSAAA